MNEVQYERMQELANNPTDAELIDECDAYGHMTWTVGNSDWVACFDAVRFADRIAYEVVVNCESGGFTDTMETGVISIDDASAIQDLKCMPSYWADICFEHYLDVPQRRYGPITYKRVAQRWAKHIDGLIMEWQKEQTHG